MIINRFKTAVIKLRGLGLIDADIARDLGISAQNFYRKITLGKTLDADFWEKFKKYCEEKKVKI